MNSEDRLALTVQVLNTSYRLLRSGCFTPPAMLTQLPASGWRQDEVDDVLDFLVGAGVLRPLSTDAGTVYFAGPGHPLHQDGLG